MFLEFLAHLRVSGTGVFGMYREFSNMFRRYSNVSRVSGICRESLECFVSFWNVSEISGAVSGMYR